MKTPDKKLHLAALALVLVNSACSINKPEMVAPPKPKSPTPIPTITLEISERRRLGIMLENLDFANQSGRLLEQGTFYQVGKIRSFTLTDNYEVRIDPKQLLSIASECRIDEIGEDFTLEFADRYFAFDPKGKREEIDVISYSDGPTVRTQFGLFPLFGATRDILNRDYQISLDKNLTALENLATLEINRAFHFSLCGSSAALRLAATGASPKQIDSGVQNEMQVSYNYADKLIRGEITPAILIRSKNLTY